MIGPEQTVSEQMRERRRNGAILILVALVLAFTLGATWRIDTRADKGDATVEQQGHEIQTLSGQVKVNGQIANGAKAAAEEANRRLAAAGKPTVPVPTVTPVDPPSTEPDAVSLDEVRSVVLSELAGHQDDLTQAEINQIARVAASMVPKPKDGKSPTAAELNLLVSTTLAAYCAGGRCDGNDGADGKPGATVTGPPGKDAPAVTDEQLEAAAKQALASYCGQDSKPCQGPTGPAGPTGPTGPPGKDAPPPWSTVDQDCVGDGAESYWRIYLSNGPDQKVVDAKGPCRIGPEPE